MNELYYGIAITPLTVGVVQAIKETGYLEGRFASLVSIVVAVALTVIAAFTLGSGFDNDAILLGVMYGLAASGLYSGVQAIKGE